MFVSDGSQLKKAKRTGYDVILKFRLFLISGFKKNPDDLF
jgi:hypothetical protein